MKTLICEIMTLIVLVTVVSCAGQKQSVRLTRDAEYNLLPSTVFNTNQALTQRITFEYKDAQYVLIGQLELNPKGLVLVAMSELGQTLFSIKYINNQFSSEIAAFMPRLPEMRYLLADLQLIYWPLGKWQQHMSGTNLQITEIDENNDRQRLVKRDEKTVISIDYTDKSIIFQHFERSYQFYVETLVSETL